MTLTELQDEVYKLTNRPDLTDMTSSVVRSATLKLHQCDYFYKDLYETGAVFLTAEFLQQLDYRGLIPTWRSLKYIRKTDSSGATDPPLGQFLDIIDITNSQDDYYLNKSDVCYVAGSVIQIKSSTELQYIILGCYRNPNITEAGYSSWISSDHPYAIVFEAAANVFKAIGDTDQFAAYTMLAKEEKNNLVISNIVAVGE